MDQCAENKSACMNNADKNKILVYSKFSIRIESLCCTLRARAHINVCSWCEETNAAEAVEMWSPDSHAVTNQSNAYAYPKSMQNFRPSSDRSCA